MGNPVRPWRNFLTVWEKLDLDGQNKLATDAARTVRQLRAHRKDIDSRIAYWEATLEQARTAKRDTEIRGRSRERHERVIKSRNAKGVRGNYVGRFTKSSEKAAQQ